MFFRALTAWSRLNPMAITIATPSSFGTNCPDLGLLPGGTNGELKSEKEISSNVQDNSTAKWMSHYPSIIVLKYESLLVLTFP